MKKKLKFVTNWDQMFKYTGIHLDTQPLLYANAAEIDVCTQKCQVSAW